MLCRIILHLSLLVCLATTLSAAQLGQPLLPFHGTDLNGEPYDLQEGIGNRPIVLIFWASWCPTCKSEVPKINQLAEKYQPLGMEFIAVNVGFNDTVERAQAFAQQTGMNYRAYFDGSGTLAKKYRLQGIPTVIIADRHGIIRFRNFTTPDITDAFFEQLSAQ